jgi:hypothetical protein
MRVLGVTNSANTFLETLVSGQALAAYPTTVSGTGMTNTGTGTFTWTCPVGVKSVSVVAVGGGGGGNNDISRAKGGGGGGLGWKNNIPVTPGENYLVVAGIGGPAILNSTAVAGSNGGDSYFSSLALVAGLGGAGATIVDNTGALGGGFVGDGGGNGGAGGTADTNVSGAGGAGGYSGNGGAGGSGTGSGGNGSGGGGGGGGAGGTSDASGAGGGVGLLGEGASGTGGAGSGSNGLPGTGGSGGANGSESPGSNLRPSTGGNYGGGGGASDAVAGENGPGGIGAVRIIWGTTERAFPSTNTIDIDIVPENLFFDDFETFTGWTTVGTGVIARSTARAYAGTASLIKTTNGDPNGGSKLLGTTVTRGWTLEAWIYSDAASSSRTAGTGDRISILDASGNGYTMFISDTTVAVESRTTFSTRGTLSSVAATRTEDVWYRAELISAVDNTFTLNIYNAAGSLTSTTTSPVSTLHTGPFDTVAVLGGGTYHVDNLKLTSLI